MSLPHHRAAVGPTALEGNGSWGHVAFPLELRDALELPHGWQVYAETHQAGKSVRRLGGCAFQPTDDHPLAELGKRRSGRVRVVGGEPQFFLHPARVLLAHLRNVDICQTFRRGAMSTARLRSRRAAAGFWVPISGSAASAGAGTARGAGAGADALRAASVPVGDNLCRPGPASPGRRRTVAGVRSRAWPSSLSNLPRRNDRICHTRRRSSSLFAPRSRGIR